MRLDGPRGPIACALAGLVLPLAFSPFELFALAPLSVAVLFFVWTRVEARRALLCGWVYGLASFGFGVFWIHESFQFNHIALGWAIVLTGLLVMFLALYPALVGYGVRRASAGEAIQLVVLMPAAWVVAEWVRGWLFTGFTWLQLGYSQVGSPLDGLLPIGGILLASWAVAASAGLVVLAARAAGRRRWRWLGVVLALWAASAGLGAIRWTGPAGDALAVALVQGNVPQGEKWLPRMREPTLARYLELTRAHWDADIVVWPESALPGLRDRFDAYVEGLDREARANGTRVILGVPSLDRETLALFNSVIAVGAARGDRDAEMTYHKRHLVPFGEYLPLDALVRPVTEALGLPVADFDPGADEQPLLEAAGHRLGVSVCYEIAFGDEIVAALPEAAALVTVSNDAWFGSSIGPHQHMQIARARARETGRYLLRATNTGVTAIVAPDGTMSARVPQFETAVLAGEILPMQGMTPYARTGDAVVVALALLALLAGFAAARRRSAGG